jgi:hypothetical protein
MTAGFGSGIIPLIARIRNKGKDIFGKRDAGKVVMQEVPAFGDSGSGASARKESLLSISRSI